MAKKAKFLLIEDDQDNASDVKDDIEALVDATVTSLEPPINLLDLAIAVKQIEADAVILDEVLQPRSNATYVGKDAFDYLSNAFPGLPMIILTDYPHNRELKDFPSGKLIRKNEFSVKKYRAGFLKDFMQLVNSYRQRRIEHKKGLAGATRTKQSPAQRVTKKLVEQIVQQHFEADDAIEQIVWFKGSNKEIRLIEINRMAFPSKTIQVLSFAPSEVVPFPILIADVRPTEWKKVSASKIPLPEGWNLKTSQVFNRI